MLYFKHSELVDTYRVSLKTVHNWIDAAKRGKLDLELYAKNGRTYIANTPGNLSKLQKLSDEGKKYRNARYQKVVSPKKEFYDIFTNKQILDIISNLAIHKEIPHKYSYMNGGARAWDEWVSSLAYAKGPNMIHNSLDLVRDSLPSIDSLLNEGEKINVIDLGVGNAIPVKDLVGHLLEKNVLNRYIAIDISQEMLNIAEKNLKEWYGDTLNYECHIRDFSYEHFDDLVMVDQLNNEDGKIVNLVLLFDATTLNFRDPADALRSIYANLSEHDLLVFTYKPDTEESRKYFDFGSDEEKPGLPTKERHIPDLLNIDKSLYDVEVGYNDKKRMRYIRIRLNTAIVIEFKFANSVRRVALEKGEAILLWRIWHQTGIETINEFEKAGFMLLRANMTKDRERLLIVTGVDNKTDYARP
jgi:SAM-dependent methyltransferase